MGFWCPFEIKRKKKKQPKEKGAAPQEAPKSSPPPPKIPGTCCRNNPCMAAYIMENLRNYQGDLNIHIGINGGRPPPHGGSSFPLYGGLSVPLGRSFSQRIPLDYGCDYDDYGLQTSFVPPPRHYNQMQFQHLPGPGLDPYDDYDSHRPFARRPRPYNRMPFQRPGSGFDYDDDYGYGPQRTFAPLFNQARDFYGSSAGYY